MTATLDLDFPTKTRRSVLVILALIAVTAIAVLFLAAMSYFRASEVNEANNRLTLYNRSLNDSLERFQHLPFVLARDPLVMAAHAAPSHAALNRRFRSFAEQSGLEAIYLMDRSGAVLAASNYNDPVTFVGKNYGFRPYFQSALAGTRGEFFGVGATTGRPGYFVSEPVRDADGAVTGVVAIKLDMSELQRAWEEGGERVFVSNPDGIIVLASDARWLYHTVASLTETQKDAIRKGRQFGTEPLAAFGWVRREDEVSLDGGTFLHVSAPADRLTWTVHYLLSEGRVYERALLVTVVLGLALSALLVVATFLRSERIKTALRVSQADRHDLRQAYAKLEAAQEELARTGKMAALGQLSASVTHELGQPLSAMRNYIAAAEINRDVSAEAVVQKLKTILQRMESITSQLRFFAKPGAQPWTSVALQDVFSGAMDLVAHDLRSAEIRVVTDLPEAVLTVQGDRQRLEQVIVNLTKNALTAMAESDERVLRLTVRKEGGNAIVSVEDTGCGLAGTHLSQLQEPFHTTHASGNGMGLGLSIVAEIVKEHRGALKARDLDGRGARFDVTLPLASAES